VAKHDGLVDLNLPEPRLFVDRGKYFDGDAIAAPLAQPNFAKAALANNGL
jgi:hypothetical protein